MTNENTIKDKKIYCGKYFNCYTRKLASQLEEYGIFPSSCSEVITIQGNIIPVKHYIFTPELIKILEQLLNCEIEYRRYY